MDYSFTEIFDIPQLTALCESYTKTNGVVTALLDLEGNVHIKTGWQDICTQFHRQNPQSAQRCLESDTDLASQLASGSKYNVYQCKNGLVDIAVPIFVDGTHIANFFTGQFLFKEPDKEYFERQGKALGYELIPYMKALDGVPVFSREEIKSIMEFLTHLAQLLGEMGKAKLDLMKLRESELEQMRALASAKTQLEKLATEDPLTGVANRREFGKRLDIEFYRAHRYHSDLSLAIIDVDDFKHINDTYGHLIGDEVLKTIAAILTSSVRQSDTVSRMGGDEFCVICPEGKPEVIARLMEKIRVRIADTCFQFKDVSFHTSCSIGVSGFARHMDHSDELMTNADKALYRAKAQGRNQVALYLPQQASCGRYPYRIPDSD